MLEVKVILHDANTREVRELANMRITNDGTGDPLIANYDITATAPAGLLNPTVVFKYKGRVKDHDRHSGVWRLVAQAIRSLKP